jgi:hypothetical protein
MYISNCGGLMDWLDALSVSTPACLLHHRISRDLPLASRQLRTAHHMHARGLRRWHSRPHSLPMGRLFTCMLEG